MLAGLFFVGAGLALVAWVLTIVEVMLTARFNEASYRLGPALVSFSQPAPGLKLDATVGAIRSIPGGQFKVLSPEKVLFRPDLVFFAPVAQTPFSLKGTLQVGNGMAQVTGRVPLGSVLLFAGWLLAWMSAFAFFTGPNPGRMPMLWMWGLGLVLGGSFVSFSLTIERRRFLRRQSDTEVVLRALARASVEP
jgi:hypothetical protein